MILEICHLYFSAGKVARGKHSRQAILLCSRVFCLHDYPESLNETIRYLFQTQTHKTYISNRVILFQISPPETIHDEDDGVCHIFHSLSV